MVCKIQDMIGYGLLWMLAASSVATVPSLTEQDYAVLEDTIDGGDVDEAAFYPLLRNAMQWNLYDDVGAIVPNYELLLEAPAAHRGKLFLIEGAFAVSSGPTIKHEGRSMANPFENLEEKLTRPGPWPKSIQRWPILVKTDPEQLILAYLVNPPNRPQLADRVRLPARFFKSWVDQDLDGNESHYLVFVGHGAEVDGLSIEKSANKPYKILALSVAVLFLCFLFLQRAIKSILHTNLSAQKRSIPAVRDPDTNRLEQRTKSSQDAAEALAELDQRNNGADQ